MPKLILPAHAVMAENILRFGSDFEERVPFTTGDDNWTDYAWRFSGPEGAMTVAFVFPSRAASGFTDQTAADMAAAGAIQEERIDGDAPLDLEGVDRSLAHWWRTSAPAPVRVRIPVQGTTLLKTDFLGNNPVELTAVDGHVEVELTEYPVYLIERR